MRDAALVFTLLGSLIELFATIGGPALSSDSGYGPEWLAAAPTGVALVVAVVATLGSVVVAVLVMACDGNGRRAGLLLIGAAVVGSLASGNGLYFLGAGFTVLAGLMALFVRPRRRRVN